MIFPIYRRPGGVVFLDDDPAYLEMLAEVIARAYAYRGDSETYDDLQNADLVRVIERRKGLPDGIHSFGPDPRQVPRHEVRPGGIPLSRGGGGGTDFGRWAPNCRPSIACKGDLAGRR